MYHSLLHPSGKGALSNAVMGGVWRISKGLNHRFGSAVGPGAMVAVIALWVGLQALGWAFIYLPHIPDGFSYSAGIEPSRYNDFAEALYVSLVTLTTLGFGDVVAVDPWVRIGAPLEALTGFALLTSALTWFTQVYPPLSRRRALALELKGLADTGYAKRFHELNPLAVSCGLDRLASGIAKARIDFTQHRESYYFQEDDPGLSLARHLPYALTLRDTAAGSAAPEITGSAAILTKALEELGNKLDDEFLHTGGELPEVLASYAQDHGRRLRYE